MPRIPKPFLHKGWYKTNAGGNRQHPLCREEEGLTQARRLLNLYLGGFAEAKEKGQAGPGSGVARPSGSRPAWPARSTTSSWTSRRPRASR